MIHFTRNTSVFAWRAALHNLDYYADLTSQLQNYASTGGLETLVTGLLGSPLTRLVPVHISGKPATRETPDLRTDHLDGAHQQISEQQRPGNTVAELDASL